MAIRKIVSRAITDGSIASADIGANPVFSGTDSLIAPKGTTEQRNATPVAGMLRYNTTIGLYEQYTATGWQAVDAPPTVSSISPSTFNGESGTTITLTGTGFKSGATVKFISNGGTEYTAGTTTFVSSTSVTATTPQDFTVAQEPFDVKIINSSGLAGVLENALDCGGSPTWTTASGTIATVADQYGSYTTVATIAATDPDSSATISYSITSGSLPAGMSLNSSTGVISGDPNNVSSSTTSTFTATATDNAGNSSARQFSIVVTPAADGTSSARAGASASAIKSLSGTTTNGLYWININGTPFEIYCDMNRDGGGWMLTYRCKNYNDQGCTQGTWDFDIALGAGGSTAPTSPTGALGGLTQGFSPSNRWALWTSTGATVARATAGTSSTINIDCKYTGTYPDRANMWLYGATGNNNNPIGGNSGTGSYSNTYVPGNQASNTNGTTVNQVVYIYANNFGLTNGSSYSLYSFGYLNCGCCEYYSINGSDAWNTNSTGVHLFGDGRAVSNYGQSYAGEWTSFWIK